MAAECQIVNICGVKRRICRRANGTIKSSVAVGRTVKRSKKRSAKRAKSSGRAKPRRMSWARRMARANAATMKDTRARAAARPKRATKRKAVAKSKPAAKRKGRATYTAVPTKVSSKFTCVLARVKGKCVKVCHAKVGKTWREVSRTADTNCK